jgi:WD40 repeat protein
MTLDHDLRQRDLGASYPRCLQRNPHLLKRLTHTASLQLANSSVVNSVGWSSDGSLLVAGGDDSKLRIWSISSGTCSTSARAFDSVRLGVVVLGCMRCVFRGL